MKIKFLRNYAVTRCRLFLMKLRFCFPAAVLSIPLTLILFWITGLSDFFFELSFDNFKWPPYNIDVQKQVALELLGYPREIKPVNIWTQFRILHYPTCKNNRLTRKRSILVIVKSSPERINNREAIRSSYASSIENNILINNFRFRIVFVMGKPLDFTLLYNLELENNKFGDLIIGDFIDNYFNNTFKFIHSIGFAKNYCNNGVVPFVLLLDDDYLFLPWNLEIELEKHISHERLYMGWRYDSSPFRLRWKKFKVSISEYPFNAYPPYITAGAVLLSGQTVNEFYFAIQYTEIFIFDDIYAGILAYLLAIQVQHNPNFPPYPNFGNKNWWNTTIAAHGYSPNSLLSTYNEILKIKKS
ncbi:Hexosyltransferase [Meloidogyne graminicola]|uniref:Hexosyltransferase n=1 Tax=Meloidogyne graminicola TaxID=189291 RepID=A0A8S9ZDN3_9BILA|nr:Hexosyltransferase [Meloidogyne graminicola]